MSIEYDISMVAGDTYDFGIRCRSIDNSIIELTDAIYRFQVRASLDSEDIEIDKLVTVSEIDGVEGVIDFSLTSEETEVLLKSGASDKYFYAIRVRTADSSDVQTILSGVLEVIKGII